MMFAQTCSKCIKYFAWKNFLVQLTGSNYLEGNHLEGSYLGLIIRGTIIQASVVRVAILMEAIVWGAITRGKLSWGGGGNCPRTLHVIIKVRILRSHLTRNLGTLFQFLKTFSHTDLDLSIFSWKNKSNGRETHKARFGK